MEIVVALVGIVGVILGAVIAHYSARHFIYEDDGSRKGT